MARPPLQRRTPQPLARLSPPPGGPPALYRAARRARVRALLGPAAGRHLLDVREAPDAVELRFAGRGWERALEGELEELAPRVARVLGRSTVELVVRSCPDALPPVRPGAAPTRPRAEPPGGSRRERLERIAARLRARGEPLR
jgi:hypothetical protein